LPSLNAVRTAPEETGKTQPRALLGQKGRRTLAILPEMEIEADRRPANTKTPDQDALDEIGGRGGG
jgi:hypothetical protein